MKKRIALFLAMLFFLATFFSCSILSISKKEIEGEGEFVETVYTNFEFTKLKVTNVTRKGAVNEKPVAINIIDSTEKKIVFTTQENLVSHISFSVSSGVLTIKGKANEALKTETLQIDIYGYSLTFIDLGNAKGTIDGVLLGNESAVSLSKESDMKLIGGTFASLKVSCSGASEISVKEITANQMNLSISGSSTLKSSDLNVQSAKLDVSGTSVAKFEAISENLNITISGASTLKLIGSSNDVYVVESGASILNSEEMEIKSAELVISGASFAKVNVTDELSAKASSSSEILYKGSPILHISSSGSSTIEEFVDLESE